MALYITFKTSDLLSTGWSLEDVNLPETIYVDGEEIVTPSQYYKRYWVKGEYRFGSYDPTELTVDYYVNRKRLEEAGLLDLPHHIY